MRRIVENNSNTGVLSIEAAKEEVEELLKEMTDNNYNGNNGESYYTEVNGVKMSRLNKDMLNFNTRHDEVELANFIENVLRNNYANHYYADAKIEVSRIGGNIVACVSCIY